MEKKIEESADRVNVFFLVVLLLERSAVRVLGPVAMVEHGQQVKLTCMGLSQCGLIDRPRKQSNGRKITRHGFRPLTHCVD